MTKNVWPENTGNGATESSTPPRPMRWSTAVGTQLRFLLRGRRRDMIIFLVFVVAVQVIAAVNAKMPVLHGQDAEDGGVTMRFEWFAETDFGLVSSPGLIAVILSFSILLIASLVWALAVWYRESPSERGYHWALPVERGAHDLARVTAGGLWLLVGLVVMLAAVILGLVIGGRGVALSSVSVVGWTNYFLGPITVYLLVSVAAVGFDRPGRVVGFTYLFTVGMYMLFTLADFEFGRRIFHELVDGNLGYQRALAEGFFGDLVPLPSGERTVGWFFPAAMWIGLALGGVIVAAQRRRER